MEIDEYLTADEAALGDFSLHEARFHRLELAQPYLLENLHGGTWAENGNRDYIYDEEEESVGSITDATTRYLMTVYYRTSAGGAEKMQQVYLPKIARNEWNKIFARVKSDGYELQLHVLLWEVEEIEVNFEDELSYSSQGWDEETLLEPYPEENNGIVHLNPEETAVLRFTLQSPKTATWRASLEGDVTAFEFVDGSNEGTIQFTTNAAGEQIPEPLEIKLRVTDPESQDRHEAVLHVYASIGGQDYELDLTHTSGEAMQPDDDEVVVNFTLLQSL